MKIQNFCSSTLRIEQFVFRSLYVVIFVAALLNFARCTPEKHYDPSSQSECEHCNEDVDCCCNMKCSGFYNNSGVYFRCATPQTNTCPE